ncbi:MAG: hypothetical protein RRY55_01215 [Bacteroidales bacterium]
MAYNRENLLKRVVEIQDIVLEYKLRDVPQRVIYTKYIADRYHISYSCFNRYLALPAKIMLKCLQPAKAEQSQQLKLFDK